MARARVGVSLDSNVSLESVGAAGQISSHPAPVDDDVGCLRGLLGWSSGILWFFSETYPKRDQKSSFPARRRKTPPGRKPADFKKQKDTAGQDIGRLYYDVACGGRQQVSGI